MERFGRLKAILLRTVFPITIGAAIVVGFFLLDDRLTVSDVESCDDFHLSNMDYAIALLFIVVIGSFYQLTIGDRLLKKLKHAKILSHLVDTISFAGFFTLVIFTISLFRGNRSHPIEDLFLAVLTFGALGASCKIVTLIFNRFLSHE
jgi:uncharacterized membrane protein SirB2